MEMLQGFQKAAVKNAQIRGGWNLMSREEQREKDDGRTAAHNAVIRNVNMLARYLSGKGKDVSWRDDLGDEVENRKRIGDFACFVSCIMGIDSR